MIPIDKGSVHDTTRIDDYRMNVSFSDSYTLRVGEYGAEITDKNGIKLDIGLFWYSNNSIKIKMNGEFEVCKHVETSNCLTLNFFPFYEKILVSTTGTIEGVFRKVSQWKVPPNKTHLQLQSKEGTFNTTRLLNTTYRYSSSPYAVISNEDFKNEAVPGLSKDLKAELDRIIDIVADEAMEYLKHQLDEYLDDVFSDYAQKATISDDWA